MADDLLNGLLAKARGGDTSAPSSMDTPVLINIAPDQRKSLRYDSPELNDYASFVERRHGLPEGLLKAVKNIGEKSNSGQVSPKGARGVMQFMPATWNQYGKGAPTDQVAEARAQLAAWNEKNPGLPVRIDLANILRRAREAQMLAADRALKAAPKEMRAQAIKMTD